VTVRLEICLDSEDPVRLASFWAAALGYQVSPSWDGARYLALLPPGPGFPKLYLQRVSEPKATKNRIHFDLWTGRLGPEVERLVALGARRLGEVVEGSRGNRWQVMADPEGNEFCVVEELPAS